MKFRAAIAAVVSFLLVVTLLVPTPPAVNSLTWRYYTIADGTRADRQIDSILYRYPSRWVWPYRRTATSYSYYQEQQYGLPCIKSGVDPYEWRSVCRAWETRGPIGMWKGIVGIEANWDGYGVKDEGWYNMKYRVTCNPVMAIAVTVNSISCGVLSESSSMITLGWYFSTTTQSNDYVPTTTVWWRSYITCYKYQAYCLEPSPTVPAG